MNRLARFAGFGRAEASPEPAPHHPVEVVERMDAQALRDPIIEALRGVYDPEIPVNIYDLGLIYTIAISPTGDVAIDMTLTAPACPVAGLMPQMVKDAVAAVEGVGEIAVELVWDPPWSQANMSDEAKLELGML
jgi:FeS assembly SUF system protein